jgi:hypothetical protein
MLSLKVGQEIHVDLSGLRLGRAREDEMTRATVIALDPGAITVLVTVDEEPSEVTVSPGRVYV